jgi:hypothetical protein
VKNTAFCVLVALLLFFQSCAPTEENILEDGISMVEFQKKDSLTVTDVLAQVFLYQGAVKDYHIFRDMASSEVYIYDKSGQLVDQWNKKGDVPGTFSMSSSNFHYNKAGNAVLVDIMHGLKEFSLEGEVIQDHRIFQNQVSLGGMFSLFNSEQLIQKNGKEYLLYSLDIIEEYDGKYGPDFLANRKNLLLTEIATNETQKLIPFPEGSLFLNGKAFFFRDIRPVFHYDETTERLYLMFKGEPILYTYDWSEKEPKLIKKHELPLEGFERHEGFEAGVVGLGQISDFKKRPYASSIINLTAYGNDLLITYNPSPTDKGAIAQVVAEEATDETKKRLREESKMRTVLLRPNGQMLPVSLPEMYQPGFRVVGDQVIWMKKLDPTIESEEFTVYWES